MVSGGEDRPVCTTGGYSNNADPYVFDENEANAAYIVKACNAYPKLVEALTIAEVEARRYASHYKQSSDGRNTFLLLADKIAQISEAALSTVEDGQ